MLELLLIILVLLAMFGGWRYHSGGFTMGDPISLIVLIIFVLIVLSLLTPYPYRVHGFW